MSREADTTKRTTIEFMIGWLDALRRDDVTAPKAAPAPDVVWQACATSGHATAPPAPNDCGALHIERGMVVQMPSSFEPREPPDPWAQHQPRYEGLASEGGDRFFLLGRLPSGEPVRTQLRPVSATELRRLFIVDAEEAGGLA